MLNRERLNFPSFHAFHKYHYCMYHNSQLFNSGKHQLNSTPIEIPSKLQNYAFSIEIHSNGVSTNQALVDGEKNPQNDR